MMEVVRGAMVTVATLLAACGPASPPGEEPTPRPGTPSPLEGEVVITERDSGEHVRVTTAARPVLRLDSAYLWEEPRIEGDPIELVRVDYFQDPGFFEWELRPAGPGTTVIRSSGERDCPPGSPCPEEPFEFEVILTVVEA
jgi:hypothetical protein